MLDFQKRFKQQQFWTRNVEIRQVKHQLTKKKKRTSKTSQNLISITSQSIDASMASRLVHKSALYMLSCKLENKSNVEV